jgi:hypothetical protein
MEDHFEMRRTPDSEMRYMEGFLDLPLGSLDGNFDYVMQEGFLRCKCGRIPTALDIVISAVNTGRHEKGIIVKTLTSKDSVFESSPGGRAGNCIQCGKVFSSRGYKWKKTYYYSIREK